MLVIAHIIMMTCNKTCGTNEKLYIFITGGGVDFEKERSYTIMLYSS